MSRWIALALVAALAFGGAPIAPAHAACSPIVTSGRASVVVCDDVLPANPPSTLPVAAPPPATTSAPAGPTLHGKPIPDRNNNGKLDCPDFKSWNQAERIFEQASGDPYNLDGDGDGVPCETLAGAPAS